jgi:hypothetical protein
MIYSLFFVIACVNAAPVIPKTFETSYGELKSIPAGRPSRSVSEDISEERVVNPILPWYDNDGDWLQELYNTPPVQVNTESLDDSKPAAVSSFRSIVPHPTQGGDLPFDIEGNPLTDLLDIPGPSLPSIISGRRTVSMDETESKDESEFLHDVGDVEDLPEVGLWETCEEWLKLAKSELEKFETVTEEVANESTQDMNPSDIISPVVEGSSISGVPVKSYPELLDSFDLMSDINESNLKDPLLLNKDLTENDSSGTLFNHL